MNQLIMTDYYTLLRINGKCVSMIKYGIDKPGTFLKGRVLPNQAGFSLDEQSIIVKTFDGKSIQEKQVETPVGDYGKAYNAPYASIKNQVRKLVSDKSTIANIGMLVERIKQQTPFIK